MAAHLVSGVMAVDLIMYTLRRRIRACSHKPSACMSGEARVEGPCALARGTRDKAQGQSAFEVAHLAAGGIAFLQFFAPDLTFYFL